MDPLVAIKRAQATKLVDEGPLAPDDPDSLATAYAHGYTMPAIAGALSLHPSTFSRRLVRLRAQTKS